MNEPDAIKVARALCVLRSAHPLFSANGHPDLQFLTVRHVAQMLSVHVKWVRRHIEEFPNWALVGKEEIRIPESDVLAAIDRWKVSQFRDKA